MATVFIENNYQPDRKKGAKFENTFTLSDKNQSQENN